MNLINQNVIIMVIRATIATTNVLILVAISTRVSIYLIITSPNTTGLSGYSLATI